MMAASRALVPTADLETGPPKQFLASPSTIPFQPQPHLNQPTLKEELLDPRFQAIRLLEPSINLNNNNHNHSHNNRLLYLISKLPVSDKSNSNDNHPPSQLKHQSLLKHLLKSLRFHHNSNNLHPSKDNSSSNNNSSNNSLHNNNNNLPNNSNSSN